MAHDGVLVVDKPAGPTSHDIVERARRALHERRIGHTGTLDPFATGVLPLCIGKATRLVRFLSGGEKVYHATVRLGFATTTDDVTGEPLGEVRPTGAVTDAALDESLASLVGRIDQVPPAFSAKHVAGRRSHELARAGVPVSRPATPVTVHALERLGRAGDLVEIEARCSAGTYVRALARDLGERLGTGGHLVALRRTRSGVFDLAQAVSGDGLEAAAGSVLPLSALLCELPAVRLPASSRAFVKNGRDLEVGATLDGFPQQAVERVRLLDETGALLALAVPRGFGEGSSELPRFPVLHPDVVLVD